MENRRLTIVFLLSLLIFSCKEKGMKFDSNKWNEKFDGFYEYREEMVNDLIQSHLNSKLTYNQVINKLGKPDIKNDIEERTIAYHISEKYGWNIDPIEIKTLFITFTKDSIVGKTELKHYKK